MNRFIKIGQNFVECKILYVGDALHTGGVLLTFILPNTILLLRDVKNG